MIYELRIYDTVPGRLPALNERFANHTLGFFKKHNIHVVGFWTEDIGTSNRLVYMLGYDSLADREQKWERLPGGPGLAPSKGGVGSGWSDKRAGAEPDSAAHRLLADAVGGEFHEEKRRRAGILWATRSPFENH